MDGEEEPTVLASGEAVVPSAAVVYQIALEEPLVLVPVNVTAAGAYAVFKEHGGDEVTTALVSPTDVVLTAAVEEGGEEEEAMEEEEEEDVKLTASGSQWGYALLASILVSACRCEKLVVCACDTRLTLHCRELNVGNSSRASGSVLGA